MAMHPLHQPLPTPAVHVDVAEFVDRLAHLRVRLAVLDAVHRDLALGRNYLRPDQVLTSPPMPAHPDDPNRPTVVANRAERRGRRIRVANRTERRGRRTSR